MNINNCIDIEGWQVSFSVKNQLKVSRIGIRAFFKDKQLEHYLRGG